MPFLQRPQTSHGVLREHPQHFRFAFGHGVVEIAGHTKAAQRRHQRVAPCLARRALRGVVVRPADDGGAPEASLAGGEGRGGGISPPTAPLTSKKRMNVESFEAHSGFSLQCFTAASTMAFTALGSLGSQSMKTPLSQ